MFYSSAERKWEVKKSSAHIRAQLAYGSRRDVAYSPERLATLRRDYHAARLAESIRRMVKESGPFTPEQARELTSIISGRSEVAA